MKKFKKTTEKKALNNFKKEIINKPQTIKGGPDGSRGTEISVGG
ncbi:hypothetical protein [Tenacibaculum agarivorans]|nr:hypothetical protein [Tenacibaculum agarivorans]